MDESHEEVDGHFEPISEPEGPEQELAPDFDPSQADGVAEEAASDSDDTPPPDVWLASEQGVVVGESVDEPVPADVPPADVWLASEQAAMDEPEADEPEADEGDAVQYRDPMVTAFVTIALSLVVVLLATTLGIYVYLSNLNHAPRTSAERGVSAAEVASRARPKDPKTWIELSYAYIGAERYDEALDAVASGAKLPQSEELDLVRADILRSAGRHKEAVDAYGKALKSAQRVIARKQAEFDKLDVTMKVNTDLLVRAYFGRAKSRTALGDVDGAIADFDKALKEKPTEAGMWFDLGSLHEKQGDAELAREAYANTLKYIPDHAEATEAMQRLKKGK